MKFTLITFGCLLAGGAAGAVLGSMHERFMSFIEITQKYVLWHFF